MLAALNQARTHLFGDQKEEGKSSPNRADRRGKAQAADEPGKQDA
jgi:hypothetical protein